VHKKLADSVRRLIEGRVPYCRDYDKERTKYPRMNEGMQSQCAEMLGGILDLASASPEHQETMGALLPSILSGLVSVLELSNSFEASAPKFPETCPKDLINRVILKVCTALQTPVLLTLLRKNTICIAEGVSPYEAMVTA
jgi:hypothetical protein